MFWRTGDAPASGVRTAGLQAFATALLLSGTLVLAVGAGTATAYTRSTAAQLADPATYVDAVMANLTVVPARPEKEGL